MHSTRSLLKTVFVAAVLGFLLISASDARIWTDDEGKQIEADLVEYDGTNVTLRTADGRQFIVPVSRLSPADQAYLESLGGPGGPTPTPSPSPTASPGASPQPTASPMPSATPSDGSSVNPALKKALKSKLGKLSQKIKRARQRKQSRKVKALTRKLRTLKKRLKRL